MAQRCIAVHPQTRKRCILDAGHTEEHAPEPHTPAERETIIDRISLDGMKAVGVYTKRGYPPIAISAGLLALFFRVEAARGSTIGDVLRETISALAGKPLEDHELFAYLAEKLGVPCSEIVLPGQQRGQA